MTATVVILSIFLGNAKAGVVASVFHYDAKKMLQDVKRMVDEDKKERGVTEFK